MPVSCWLLDDEPLAIEPEPVDEAPLEPVLMSLEPVVLLEPVEDEPLALGSDDEPVPLEVELPLEPVLMSELDEPEPVAPEELLDDGSLLEPLLIEPLLVEPLPVVD